jgi:hypothetical protein
MYSAASTALFVTGQIALWMIAVAFGSSSAILVYLLRDTWLHDPGNHAKDMLLAELAWNLSGSLAASLLAAAWAIQLIVSHR